ncbi:MAG: hypothetical protein RR386_08435 [Bacteroidaceae bacterium]
MAATVDSKPHRKRNEKEKSNKPSETLTMNLKPLLKLADQLDSLKHIDFITFYADASVCLELSNHQQSSTYYLSKEGRMRDVDSPVFGTEIPHRHTLEQLIEGYQQSNRYELFFVSEMNSLAGMLMAENLKESYARANGSRREHIGQLQFTWLCALSDHLSHCAYSLKEVKIGKGRVTLTAKGATEQKIVLQRDGTLYAEQKDGERNARAEVDDLTHRYIHYFLRESIYLPTVLGFNQRYAPFARTRHQKREEPCE